jgi:hypothetical protein
MKKIALSCVVFLISFSCFSQEILVDVIDHYYPVNPFADKFSAFLQGLINNPFLSGKTLHKRTDSTLFFLKGEYIAQNPFSFKPSKIEVILAESEIQVADSGAVNDTILVYQVIAYTESSLQTVKTEFTRFQREYGKRFSSSIFSDIVNNGQVEGSNRNYFLLISPVSPLSISWGRMNSKEYAYIVTVRFIARQNEAMLPVLETTGKGK